jgi:hypothetical protein
MSHRLPVSVAAIVLSIFSTFRSSRRPSPATSQTKRASPPAVPCMLCRSVSATLFFAFGSNSPRVVIGHIDFLQVRNGAVHILDYKPDARTNKLRVAGSPA